MSSSHVLPPESLAAARNPWDMAIEGLLGALLLFMPLAFGAVEQWSELVVVALAASLALCVAVRCVVDRTFRPPRTWAYLPLALFVALAALQLTPLPRGVVETLSPATLAARDDLLGPTDPQAASATLSQYPLATAHSLRLALVAASIFIVTATTFRTAPQIKRLLWIVFGVGCLQAVLALLQIFTRASGIYWTYPIGSQRLTSGSFVNYSNFSQFMNLSIGAGLALLLIRLQQERRGQRLDDSQWQRSSSDVLQQHGALILAIIVCGLAVFTSFSRNGAISLVVAAAIVGTALSARGTLGWRGWVLALVPLGAAAALLLFAFDAVYERMATLSSTDSLGDRWQLTLSTLRAWRSFPLWGIGLGAHEFVFPMFDSGTSPILAQHADNDYAQLLEETGVVGAALLAAFVLIIARMIYLLCRRGRTSLSAAAFGLAFAAVAVALHAATDFGQRLPAVFCLSAIICGLAVQIARIERESRQPAPPRDDLGRSPLVRRTLAVVALLAVAGASTWALKSAYYAFLADEWWAAASVIDERIGRAASEIPDQEYIDLIAASQHAVDYEPRNVAYGYWLAARRWQAMTGPQGWTAEQLEADPEAKAIVVRLADELAGVRKLCPTFGPPYALEGQLRLLLLGDQQGAKLIEQGVRLAPYDAPTCLIAGQIAALDHRHDDAAALLTRAASLEPDFYLVAASCLLLDMKRPDLARKLADSDYRALFQLAELCDQYPEHAELAADLRRDAEAVLRRRTASPDVASQELATLAALDAGRGDASSAITLYRRALAKDYKQIQWRLELARALVSHERFNEAMREATICLRLQPQHPAAKQLISELATRETQE